MARLFSNLAATTLASSITSSDLSLTVADASKFPTPAAGDFFVATLSNTSGVFEYVKITSVSGTTFTVDAAGRGFEGSTAQAWNAGDFVELAVTAGALNDAAFLSEDNTFTGTVDLTGASATAATQSANDNSTKLATTAYADRKADKVSGATSGNLASLDASGNLADSGVVAVQVPEKNQANTYTQDQTIQKAAPKLILQDTNALASIIREFLDSSGTSRAKISYIENATAGSSRIEIIAWDGTTEGGKLVLYENGVAGISNAINSGYIQINTDGSLFITAAANTNITLGTSGTGKVLYNTNDVVRKLTTTSVTYTGQTTITFTHSLGVVPTVVSLKAKCVDAAGDAGYTLDDIVDLGAGYATFDAGSGGTGPIGFTLKASTTAITLYRAGAIQVATGGGGGVSSLSSASKWNFYVDMAF